MRSGASRSACAAILDLLGQRVERGDADHGFVQRHGQALNRRKADAKSGEGAGSGGDGQQIDAIARDAGLFERARDFAGQPLAVRARLVAGQHRQDAVVVGNGHTSAARCCVKSENDQACVHGA